MRRTVVAAGALIGWALALPAGASCVELPTLEESFAAAPVVFTGTVTAVERNGRVAQVEVLTVWKGELPALVTVTGGPDEGPNVTTSGDRAFVPGETYAFFPIHAGSPLEDNACTATTPIDPELESRLMALVGGPGKSPIAELPPSGNSGGSAPLIWVLGMGAAAGTALLIMARRRSPGVQVEGFRLNRGDDQAAGPG